MRQGPTFAELAAQAARSLSHPEECIDVTDMTRAEREQVFFGLHKRNARK